MKPMPTPAATFIAVCGSLIGVWGLYLLETLARSAAETILARGLGALILGSFLVAVAYTQSLLGETDRRKDEPGTGEKPVQADLHHGKS
jgi:hypothetical protein